MLIKIRRGTCLKIYGRVNFADTSRLIEETTLYSKGTFINCMKFFLNFHYKIFTALKSGANTFCYIFPRVIFMILKSKIKFASRREEVSIQFN